jgi:hypothetical protein
MECALIDVTFANSANALNEEEDLPNWHGNDLRRLSPDFAFRAT